MLYLQYVNITYYVILTYPFLLCILSFVKALDFWGEMKKKWFILPNGFFL